jgi:hypothetical protein
MTSILVESCTSMFGQLVPFKPRTILNGQEPTLVDLNVAITKDFAKGNLKKFAKSPLIGDLVLAFFADNGLYYRARIESFNGSTCRVSIF